MIVDIFTNAYGAGGNDFYSVCELKDDEKIDLTINETSMIQLNDVA